MKELFASLLVKESKWEQINHFVFFKNGSFVESARKSLKAGKKIRADMISRPQNDLRHTGHIGMPFIYSTHLNQKK